MARRRSEKPSKRAAKRPSGRPLKPPARLSRRRGALPGLAVVLATALGIGGYLYLWEDGSGELRPVGSTEALVEIVLPATFSEDAGRGKRMFDTYCAACHGSHAAGRKGTAPPLVHVIYEPSHHGDEAFQRAVAVGVRQHHWGFGNMAPVDGLTRRHVARIVAYIRELQRANGIR